MPAVNPSHVFGASLGLVLSAQVLICVMLVSACSDNTAVQGIDFPEAESAPAQLMQAKCGSCHAAPHPRIHTADLWPAVVYRMQLRMRTKAGYPMTDAEIVSIIDYLQRHAGEKEK